MLFKYVVAAIPTSKEDFRQDVAKILTGELDPANLSMNCHKVSSGYVAESRPITAGREFEIVKNDSIDSIVKRKHSRFSTKDIFIDIRTNAANSVRLACLGGFAGNTRINPATQYASGSIYYNQTQKVTTANTIIYIGVTDCCVFITNSLGCYTAMHCELFERAANNGIFSYAGASEDASFAMEILYHQSCGSVNMPKGVGTIDNPTVHYRPQHLLTQNNTLSAAFSSANAPNNTLLSTTVFPLPLPDNKWGIPLRAAICQPVNAAYTPPQYLFGNIHQSNVKGVASLLGKSLANDTLGSVLVLTPYLSATTPNSHHVFYIPEV